MLFGSDLLAEKLKEGELDMLDRIMMYRMVVVALSVELRRIHENESESVNTDTLVATYAVMDVLDAYDIEELRERYEDGESGGSVSNGEGVQDSEQGSSDGDS